MLHIKIDEFEPESSYDSSSPAPAVQARKPDRACDFCRKRKTRCDGAPTPNSKCSNCRRNQCPCTYQEASRPRGPPKAYITALEDRMERFERLLKRLRPEADFTDVLGPPLVRGSWRNDQIEPHQKEREGSVASSSKSSVSPRSSSFAPTTPAMLRPRDAPESGEVSSEDCSTSSDEDTTGDDKPRRRRRARLCSISANLRSDENSFDVYYDDSVRFHGKSSFMPLLQATRHVRRASTKSIKSDNSPNATNHPDHQGSGEFPEHRRKMFWTLPPWEKAWEKRSAGLSNPLTSSVELIHDFPPSDLVLSLLSIYFHHINTNFPLLHPPTFYTHFREGLHFSNSKFAAVVWGMMAIAARWSDDPRVLWGGWGSPSDSGKMEEDDDYVEWASAGWRFFLRGLDSVSFCVASPTPPTLFEIQFCSLAAMFLRGTSLHPASWTIIGAGLRKVMDVGAHRKKTYSGEPNIDDELWKRAFWMLVIFDRLGSAALGRPCCAREEDFDLDFPHEVDDEYWSSTDDSRPAFQQPQERPSRISAMVCMAKLSQIIAYAIRTIYCIDKSKVLLGLVSDDWQEQIVSQLNAALDEWVAAIPAHLKWSPNMKDDVFSSQSALIYTTYYLTLILIYRPFGSTQTVLPDNDVPGKSRKPFPFPADSICASAAHSATVIVDAQVRKGSFFIPNMINVAQMCSVIQLMNYYAHVALRKGHDPGNPSFVSEMREQERAMEDVDKCIRCLELAESRWIMARKFLSRIRESLPSAGANDVGVGGRPSNVQDYVTVNTRLSAMHSAPVASPYGQGGSFAQRPSPPIPGVQDSAQALMSEANWRWFQENAAFQDRSHKRRRAPEPLRHHLPLQQHSPPRTTSAPGVVYSAPLHTARDVRPYVVMSSVDPGSSLPRSASRTSPGDASVAGVANRVPAFVPGQPISSTNRLGRAAQSGQFLAVSTPQSAAREEPTAWRPMDVPKHPYEAVLQAAVGHPPEHRSQHYGHQHQR